MRRKQTKSVSALIITAAMVLSLFGGITAYANDNFSDFGGGNGTPESPYKLYNHFHLNNVRSFLGAHFIQMNDIDLTDATDVGGTYYYGGSGWFPIGNDYTTLFTGSYDGGGYIITGLKIKRSLNYVGLFGYSSGTIKNLGMADGNVSSSYTVSYFYVGGIVGFNSGTISNCYNTSNISSSNSSSSSNTSSPYTGGIAGYNRSTISDCYNTGSISSASSSANWHTYAGGITGYNAYGTINNSYNTGNIFSSNSSTSYSSCSAFSGGIAGTNTAATISNCYNTGNASSFSASSATKCNAYAGGVVGKISSGTTSSSYNAGKISSSSSKSSYMGGVVGSNGGTINNCYTLFELHYNTSGTALTIEQMKNQSCFAGLDFGNVWHYGSTTHYHFPILRSVKHIEPAENYTDFNGGIGKLYNPFRVSSVEHLNNVRDYLSAYFIQMNDIDLTAATNIGGTYYNSGSGWLTIGKITDKFTGNYDGGGFSVIGLMVNRTASAGLFAFNNGVIKNLGIVDCNVFSIAYSSPYTIAELSRAGGIAATNSGKISNCYNTGNVSDSASSFGKTYTAAGGIAGINSGTISDCYNTGNVSDYSSPFDTCISSSNAGGIAGNNSGTISNCYNTGNVYASHTYSNSRAAYAGGIAGYNSGTISNVYNIAEITATAISETAYAGGLVGYISGGSVSFGYTIGDVSATAPTACPGKVIGYNSSSTLSRLYFLGTNMNIGVGNEGNRTGMVEPRTEEQLKTKSSLTGFDFDAGWNTVSTLNNGFPVLRNILPPTPDLDRIISGLSYDSINKTYTFAISFTNDTSSDVTTKVYAVAYKSSKMTGFSVYNLINLTTGGSTTIENVTISSSEPATYINIICMDEGTLQPIGNVYSKLIQ